MRFNHVAIVVTDVERALSLYRDLLGFRLASDVVLPDESEAIGLDPGQLSESFRHAGARARVLALIVDEADGSFLEILHPLEPPAAPMPNQFRGYAFAAIREVAFLVDDIDVWFERVRSGGYETQTRSVWEAGGLMRSFIFYDQDGNRVQLVEQTGSFRASA